MSIKSEINNLKKLLANLGYDAKNIGLSGAWNDKELFDYLSCVYADIVNSKTNNSSKVNKKNKAFERYFYKV